MTGVLQLRATFSQNKMYIPPSYPEDAKSFTEGPSTQKVYFKVVIEDNDGVLLAVQLGGLRVRVESAFCTRPPLQQHHHF